MADCLLLNDSPAVLPPPVKSQNLFTSANAREMAEKSRIARVFRYERQIKAAVDEALRLERAQVAAEYAARGDTHPKKALLSVRVEIERTYSLLSQTVDPKAHAALSTSLAKLTDVERVLDGRPLPGQLRPFQPRASKKGADTTPGPVE